MKEIIMISGKARNGKTTLANLLLNKVFEVAMDRDPVLSVAICPLAESLKNYARMLGWDGEKDEKGRTFLQQLSGPIKAYRGDDVFSMAVIEKALQKESDVIMIDDWRFKKEYMDIKKWADAHDVKVVTVRIERKGYKSDLTEAQLNDPSEIDLDDFKFDFYVDNNDELSDLPRHAKKLIDEVLFDL